MKSSPTLHDFVRAEVLRVLADMGYTAPPERLFPRPPAEPAEEAVRAFLGTLEPVDVSAADLYQAWERWALQTGAKPLSGAKFGFLAARCCDLVRRRIGPAGRTYTVLPRP